MAVGPCGDQAERDAARVGGERALQALLPTVDGAVTGLGVDPDELDAPWHNDYPL